MNGDETKLVLQDSAAPLDMIPDHGLWPWWLAAGILVLLIPAICAFFKMRKLAAIDITQLRKDSFRDAMAALNATTAANAREAAVQASLILRKYLSIAAWDPALFETHEEFISRHDAMQLLTQDARHAAETGFSNLAAMKYSAEILEIAAAEVIAQSRTLLETLHHGFAK